MRSDPSNKDGFVALRAVTKRFGQIVANHAIDLQVDGGEVLALVGENGAGKSTIVNMLSGLFLPDEGQILIEGRPVRLHSPSVAVGAGIGTVHQHYMLVPTLTALDNIALQQTELGLGRLDRAALAARVRKVAADLGFELDLDSRIAGLDVAQQQRIEIVKAMMHAVRLLVLDEPTAVLGVDDRRHLFEVVARLRSQGTAIILITHKLEDIFAISDRAVILRGGRVVAAERVADLTAADIVAHMVGTAKDGKAEAIASGAHRRGETPVESAPLCSVRELTLKRANGSVAVSGLSIDLNAGEILALAGVEGNGQSEFVACLAGLSRPAEGSIECLGERSDGRRWCAARLRAKGLRHVPEDRRRYGIVGSMSLARNHLLGNQDRTGFFRWGMIRARRLANTVGARLAEYQVVAPGPDAPMEDLSGGNQQKTVLARELDGETRILLAAHPSRGLDIKTIRFVHGVLEEVRSKGAAILLQSSDIDEIMAVADKVVVFSGGRVFGPAACATLGRSQLGSWIAGHHEGST
jgi:general nucleoside transport system ATP-binding protein